VAALSSSSAATQVRDDGRLSSEQRTQVKVPVESEDPETLRPEEAQQAAEQIRRNAQTKLVSAIPTMYAPPPPQPTLVDGDSVSLIHKPRQTLQFALIGALLMAGALLVLYALLG